MSTSRLDDIAARLHALEQELEQEIDATLEHKREQFQYSLQRGRVRFAAEIRKLQRRQRRGLWRYLIGTRITTVLTAPLIYSLILPFALLDLMVTIYQQLCFSVYRIPRVRRANYIAIDRHHLSYLNAIEKVNCVYCGYGNGVVAYVREVAARTEQYWCPIKHARRTRDAHRHSASFSDYGDASAYHQRLKDLRRALRQLG